MGLDLYRLLGIGGCHHSRAVKVGTVVNPMSGCMFEDTCTTHDNASLQKRARRCMLTPLCTGHVTTTQQCSSLTGVAVGERAVHVWRPWLQQVGEPEGEVADGDDQVAAHRRLDGPVQGSSNLITTSALDNQASL